MTKDSSTSDDSTAGIEVDVEGVVDFTAQLVRARTVYEPGVSDERPASDLVVDKMREWGWQPEVIELAPGRSNVIVTVDGGGGPGQILGFEGHLDVVTEGEREGWSLDPFGAEVVDGRMYGRGSADMKSGVAAMLYGVRALQLAGPFPGSVRIFALVDEEGGMTGAKHAVASGAARGVAGVIVCEPEGDEVCPTSKGALRLRVTLTGQMTHGAMPDRGRNPLPVLGRVLGALGEIQSELLRQHGTHEHLGPTFITATVVEGGTPIQMNTVPSTASLWIDIRTIPGVQHDSLVELIRSRCVALGGATGVTANVDVIDDRPAVDTPVDSNVVRCLVDAHERVVGVTPPFGGVPGTTDGTIFTRDANVPTVVYGPGGKWIAHQVDEFVAVESISRYARVYAEAARQFLGATSA